MRWGEVRADRQSLKQLREQIDRQNREKDRKYEHERIRERKSEKVTSLRRGCFGSASHRAFCAGSKSNKSMESTPWIIFEESRNRLAPHSSLLPPPSLYFYHLHLLLLFHLILLIILRISNSTILSFFHNSFFHFLFLSFFRYFLLSELFFLVVFLSC